MTASDDAAVVLGVFTGRARRHPEMHARTASASSLLCNISRQFRVSRVFVTSPDSSRNSFRQVTVLDLWLGREVL